MACAERHRSRSGTGFLVVCLALSVFAGATASAARGTPDRVPRNCPGVKKGQGSTTGDWEVAFGRFKRMPAAVKLLRQVHAKGFRCAVIEREQHIFEVAVIGLHSHDAATVIARRAFDAGFNPVILQS
jgi:hypothetical protein